MTQNTQDYYEKLKIERRKEKCRSCEYFRAVDLNCGLFPDGQLTKKERQAGCRFFSRDPWAGYGK